MNGHEFTRMKIRVHSWFHCVWSQSLSFICQHALVPRFIKNLLLKTIPVIPSVARDLRLGRGSQRTRSLLRRDKDFSLRSK